MRPTCYDELWQTVWGGIQHVGPVHRHLRAQLVRTVSSLKGIRTVLDVGCGSGESLAALAGLGGVALAGVDASQRALELAQQRVPSARLRLLDIQREALPEQFDLIISIQVVEHLLDDTAAFRHIANMAKGAVYISTIQGRMRRSEPAIGHVRNYSELELRQKLEQAGLRVIRTWGWGFPFYSPLYRTLAEWLPGGPPSGSIGPLQKLAAEGLYQLYRLNWPGRGDILHALATVP